MYSLKSFTGITKAGHRWSFEQKKNGFYIAAIQWADGDLSLSTGTRIDILKWFQYWNINIYE